MSWLPSATATSAEVIQPAVQYYGVMQLASSHSRAASAGTQDLGVCWGAVTLHIPWLGTVTSCSFASDRPQRKWLISTSRRN